MDNPTDVVSLLQGGGFDYQTYPVGRVTRVRITPMDEGKGPYLAGPYDPDPTISGLVVRIIGGLFMTVVGVTVAFVTLLLMLGAFIDVSTLSYIWADIIVGSWAVLTLGIWVPCVVSEIRATLDARVKDKADSAAWQEYQKQKEAL